MDDYRRSHVPAFGSWDYTDGLPFTQCFETARQVRYGCYPEDRDLYVAGDLYQNDVVTPAVIVVPRRRTKGRQARAKKQEQEWARGYDYEYESYDTKEPPSPVDSPPRPAARRPTPKAVDEDLYKIPPELLHSRPKRKRGFFSSCLLPVCA